MSPTRKTALLPPWTTVHPSDPREREGAMEQSGFASGQWASAIRASSHRAWTNAAKVLAAMVDDQPHARYVEGWAVKGGVSAPVWHAWVDVPLNRAERSWMRIDPTPMWRWMIEHNLYAPVLEVRASEMIEFVEPLRTPRGRARCRLPLVPLVPDPSRLYRQPMPTTSLAAEFGAAVAARASDARQRVEAHQRSLTSSVHVDGRSELDRLAALGLLPRR